MRVSLSLLGLVASGSFAAAICGNEEPTPELEILSREVDAKISTEAFNTFAPVEVTTYFHVVSSSTSPTDGNVSDQQLQDQLEVMNKAYAPVGFSFKLANTTRTVNANWASGGDEMGMKYALHKGKYSDLNMYFLKKLSDNSMGMCPFPSNPYPGTPYYVKDGCSILHTTVPGGSLANYNRGLTAVHEIGHYMGIYHTFQGGCSSTLGDRIADTPAQKNATMGCPARRDSCPMEPGDDPIHNYMDLSDDTCRTEFTPLQTKRMQAMYQQLRAGK
uniref:Metalloprotease 1 n=1 Tax=Onygena corvina TaxID=180788 RepID=A0A0B4VKX2_9EURO|nr:metalloprotease 1 [Onygena corvina]